MIRASSPQGIEPYTDHLTRIFRQTPDRHEAHRHSAPVLRDMAGDPTAVAAVIDRHLQQPDALTRGHYPVVSLSVALNEYYGLEMNCWIPLPDRNTDLSTKAIHHHGNMLLTTVTAFGPGYEHWTFRPPEELDRSRDLFALRLIERVAHPLHHVAFVDAGVAHLPMYPAGVTITLALWSNRAPTVWRDRLKRIGLLKRNEVLLRRLATRLGLARALDLKNISYFDFYPTPDGFKGMRERIEFSFGPNEDYLHSLFCIIQQTGNEHLADAVQARLETGKPWPNASLVEKLVGDLRSGAPIEGRLSTGHTGLPFANFTARQIEEALLRQPAGPVGARSASEGLVPQS